MMLINPDSDMYLEKRPFRVVFDDYEFAYF